MLSTTILPTKDEFHTLHTAADWLRSLCKNKCDSCFIGVHRDDGEVCPVSTLDSVDHHVLDSIIDTALAQPFAPSKQETER